MLYEYWSWRTDRFGFFSLLPGANDNDSIITLLNIEYTNLQHTV